jgi:selenocysteine-specific elongation factor
VLREAGRRKTVAGGIVLDTDPPSRPGPEPGRRLARRDLAAPDELPRLLVLERHAVRVEDITVLTGTRPGRILGAIRVQDWWLSDELYAATAHAVHDALSGYHQEHPLDGGADISVARGAAAASIERDGATTAPGLVDALLEDLVEGGTLVRTGSEVRVATHRPALEDRREDLDRLVGAIAAGEPTPPSVAELLDAGFAREIIEAAARSGALARISPDLVMTAAFLEQAREVIAGASDGVTVSAFRDALGTSRKYAVPLLEYLDREGVTLRRGDLRFLRS